jgi:histidinol-phosphate/aromatic aminotransferase/cobyric acid decarboxylase-like protein
VGDTFDTLERGREIVNADVLDAWFPPSPRAVEAVREHLPWLMKTSPPQQAGGLVQTIAEVRGVPPDSIVVGAGSSSLIYLALRHWLNANSRVLLPDPTYGEYAHLFERVVGCRTDRLSLVRADDFRLRTDDLLRCLWQERYDLAILVNPNNPTGQLIPRAALEPVLAQAPPHTRIWVDEAYIDYANNGRESIEAFAASSGNTVVCKSLSKGYALSGLRAAYLCGPPGLMAEIRDISPPWTIGLPAQVAAVAALRDPAYYATRYRETVILRDALTSDLKQAVPLLEVVPSAANWVLCHLPPSGPDAATVCARCREQNVFLRDAGTIGSGLDRHTLRIAVKKEADNQRIAHTLADAIHR